MWGLLKTALTVSRWATGAAQPSVAVASTVRSGYPSHFGAIVHIRDSVGAAARPSYARSILLVYDSPDEQPDDQGGADDGAFRQRQRQERDQCHAGHNRAGDGDIMSAGRCFGMTHRGGIQCFRFMAASI